jgi:hypothetical protein
MEKETLPERYEACGLVRLLCLPAECLFFSHPDFLAFISLFLFFQVKTVEFSCLNQEGLKWPTILPRFERATEATAVRLRTLQEPVSPRSVGKENLG